MKIIHYLITCAFLLSTNLVAFAAPKEAKHTQKGLPITIVAFGDSLVAGYELAQSEAFPAQLEKALREKSYNVNVQNAGVSGDTVAAGLARVDWAVPKGVDAVIVELGANDALRGIDPKETRNAFDELLQKLKDKDVELLIAGMQAPQNYGPDYRDAFASMYPDLAKKYDAIHYPFFLEGIALNPKYNLADGIHPNPQGVQVIVQNILPKVEELIKRIEAKRLKASQSQ